MSPKTNSVYGVNEQGVPIINDKSEYTPLDDEIVATLPKETGVLFLEPISETRGGLVGFASTDMSLSSDDRWSKTVDAPDSKIGKAIEGMINGRKKIAAIHSIGTGSKGERIHAKLLAYESDFIDGSICEGEFVEFSYCISRKPNGNETYRAVNVQRTSPPSQTVQERYNSEVFESWPQDVRDLDFKEFISQKATFTQAAQELYVKSNKEDIVELIEDIRYYRKKRAVKATQQDIRVFCLAIEFYKQLPNHGRAAKNAIKHIKLLAEGGGSLSLPGIGQLRIPFFGKKSSPETIKPAIPILTQIVNEEIDYLNGWNKTSIGVLSQIVDQYPEEIRPAIPGLIEHLNQDDGIFGANKIQLYAIQTLESLAERYPEDVAPAAEKIRELQNSSNQELEELATQTLEHI